jgi:hypothetical protein
MKFIDLYNRNKNTPVFRARVQQFKMFNYLAKNNPERYSVKWNNKESQFNYFESTIGINGEKTWIKFENQCPKFKIMGDFLPSKY